jgi:hypothetical protein
VLDIAGRNASELIGLHHSIVNLHNTITRLHRIVDATQDAKPPAKSEPASLSMMTGTFRSDWQASRACSARGKPALRNAHDAKLECVKMRSLILIVATLFNWVVMAHEVPPDFNPASVPERLRVLEGRIAFIKIPSQDDAPLASAQGAIFRGNIQAQIVTAGNTTSIPFELAFREGEFDRFAQGSISEADLIAFMDKQDKQSSAPNFVMLEDGAAVRIIAPRVNDGLATQVLPLTGRMSEAKLGGEVHLWVDSCFLKFENATDQELLNRGKVCR